MTTEGREIPELPGDAEELNDGIIEEDNLIPAWFNWSWIATWIFGVLYIAFYLGPSDWSPQADHAAEMAAAEVLRAEQRAKLPTSNPYRGNAEAIAAGQQVFMTTCVACHLPTGEGLVGPSLIDPYWKYGSSDAELYETVAEGRPLGMPPWKQLLGSEKIWKVLAYIETLPKTEEPGVGAPGYEPASASAAATGGSG